MTWQGGHAAWYDRFWRDEAQRRAGERDHAWYRFIVPRFLEGRLAPQARLLEVGCGAGGLASFFRHERHFGVDISTVALVAARANGLNVATAEGERLPFKDGLFDVVVCCEVMEHLDDPERTLREIGRVTRPGGLIVLTMPQYLNWWLVPIILARLGIPFFRRYMNFQRRERMNAAGRIGVLLRKMELIEIRRAAARLSLPFWEYVLPRRLRRLGFAFFDLLESRSERWPLSWLGLHAVFAATKR